MSEQVAPFDLSGRVAIVTGGNGGIGLGMARGLAANGATVVVAARNADKSASAVKELEAFGARAAAIEADVSDEAAVNHLVEETVRRFGRVDVVVNNAGTNVRKEPQDLSLAEWHLVMDTNLTSAFLTSKAAYPHMKVQGGGKFINVGSMMSVFGVPFSPAYASSKGGLVQFTKVLATAWAKDNIQANAVLPGWIDTDLTRTARVEVPGLHDRVLSRIPAGRWGDGDDLAGIAAFLASSASDYITGAVIPVDGGYASQG
ncbi:MAG TPA: glucose 1-dehydrogenase [Dehalococcoidia bacterium]|nr:glucose 1-dehydrogenase [Dehalococcoidia bacterium]